MTDTRIDQAPTEAHEAPTEAHEAHEAPTEALPAPEAPTFHTEAHYALRDQMAADVRRATSVIAVAEGTDPVGAPIGSTINDATYYANRVLEYAATATEDATDEALHRIAGQTAYYVELAEANLTRAAEAIAAHEAELARVLPWGTDADVARGVRAFASYRRTGAWPNDATAVDLVAAWNVAQDAYDADVTATVRTLRAAARSHGWQHHYDDAFGSITVVHPAWRVVHDRGVGIARSADDADVPTITRPPRDVFDLSNVDTSAEAIARGYWSTVGAHTSDFEAIAEAFHDAAVDHGWCGEYEQTVERLNRELTIEPFYPRHRATYWSVDGTVTLTIAVSELVAAEDEDGAADGVDYSDALYELRRVIRNAGYAITNEDYEVNDATDTGDPAE